MKKLWFALLLFTGEVAHEMRNPLSCQCTTAREFAGSRKRNRM